MRVLIAVEDALFGETIADYVCQQEWSDNAEFKIVHVVEPIVVPVLYDYSGDLALGLLEEQKKFGKSLLMSIAARLAKVISSTKIQEEILVDYPKEAIVNAAKKWPADLVIVGSHGRRGVSQFLLGSVSMSVLSAAPCSVLVVRLPKKDETAVKYEKQAVAANK